LLGKRLLLLLIDSAIGLNLNDRWAVAVDALLEFMLQGCSVIRADIVKSIELSHMAEIQPMRR
jgi:hypothetical protein